MRHLPALVPEEKADALRARLKAPIVFDGRNLYDPGDMRRLGFEYFPIGRAGKGQG